MGSGYQRSDEDEELNNWLKVAAISDKVGKNAEESDIATSYSALSKGQSIPEGMSDRVKLGARKMLADTMEGATIEAEQKIMNDINLKAKETGVAPHNYLRDNIDSYLTSPQNFRAVGKISKMMQERQYADAVYQKSKMEEGKLRYDEASALVSAAEGLYSKGDITGSKKMIANLSKILPIPGHVALNEETGELEAYATDLDGGGAKKTGDKVNIRGFLDAAKTVTRNEMAYGFALNSQVIQERNVENLLKASTMTNKAGQMFSGFAVTNPYDGTDTKFVVKEHGTGKDVGQFASMKDAVDNGFTVYDQKFVHGEQLIKNAKQQGLFAAEDQNMQRAEHGQRMSFGKEDQEHKRKKWDFEESLYPTKEELLKAKAEKASGKNRMADDKFSESVIKGLGAGDAPVSSDDQIRALATAKELRSMYDDHVIPTMTSELLPKINAAIASGEKPEDAIRNVAASKAGLPRAFYDIETSKAFTPEQKAEAKKALMERASSEASSKTNEDQINSMLEALYSMDTNDVSGYADAVMPSFMYDKGNNKAELLYSLGSATGLDIDGLNRLYDEYRRKRETGASPSIEAENRRTREAFAKREKIKAYTGKDTGLSMEERFSKMLERNGF